MHLETKLPFKMEKFTKVPAKITAHGLQTQEIDILRGNMIVEHKKRAEDEKHFIKKNMRGVRQNQMEYRVNQMATDAAGTKKQNFETKNVAKLPQYLQRFRQEEEEERQRTLHEIAMNKRPPGTRIVTPDEKLRVLEELQGRKAYCQDGIQNMSVTLFTTRAQNQYNGYVDNLNDIDRSLNVFERPRVFVAP